MKVYPVESLVSFRDSPSISGRISQISISANNKVTYQVVYWKDNCRYEIWVSDFELTSEIKKTTIGFR